MNDFLRDLLSSPEGKAFLEKGLQKGAEALVQALTGQSGPPAVNTAMGEENRLMTYRVLGLEARCSDDELRAAWGKFSTLPPQTSAWSSARSAYLLICLWRGIEP